MPLAGITLLAPIGLLACGLALLPLAVILLSSRRQRRAVRAIGLEPASLRGIATAAALAAGACVALGIAVAEPVLTTTNGRTARTSSEVIFVTDISRSMSASSGPGEPNRLDRARAVVAHLQAATPDVPAGISGITDRVLPFIFPTLDRAAFSGTLARSVRIDAPPPQEVSTVATNFAALTSLTRDGFFTRGVDHRTCVLVTDGESRAGADSASSLTGRNGCRLVVVRVGTTADRIYGPDGRIDAAYRPEAGAAKTLEQFARSAGGSAFPISELDAATRVVRSAAEVGPSRRVGVETTARALAPYFAGAALLCVALIFIRVYRRPAGILHRATPREYHFQTEL